MNNEIKVIRKDEYKTSTWSGGTTTELFIYPEYTSYTNIDFMFRISSAKVELEKSTFTHLPGINRELMVIDGDLELEHEGYHKIKLSRFDKDIFKGDWITKSYGKVIDFNLMMNKYCHGSLQHIDIEISERKDIKLQKNIKYNKMAKILYCVSGEISVELSKKINLYRSDLLVFIADQNTDLCNITIYNNSNKQSHIILTEVYF